MARGGILATSAAIVVAWAGGVFVAGESVHAQARKKEAPLELKEDASARPWKRYAGWPTRDYSKYHTIGNLATPPPKEPRKITGPITGDAKGPRWSPIAI